MRSWNPLQVNLSAILDYISIIIVFIPETKLYNNLEIRGSNSGELQDYDPVGCGAL
jgi:hypothetical protein